MEAKQKKKLIRDKLDVKKAMYNIRQEKKKLEKELSDAEKAREDYTRGVKIPSHDPILLTENQTFHEESYKKLLAKGPSFVPTPSAADWNELQQDFERFSNLIRKEIFFQNSAIQIPKS